MALWIQGNGAAGRESLLVRRLIDQGIRDPRVLAAFARVPRSFFVPDEARDEAEADRPLEIGCGQTISQPYVVAAMIEALEMTGRERVLEVGTGSGYATAILAEMMPVSAEIRSVEIIPELAGRAGRVLAELGYGNVQLRVGDGALGWPEAAPFDAILVSAAPYEVPPALLDQLAPGGRLVLPVGPSPEQQELQLWRRVPSGRLEKRGLMQVRFVPLTGSSQRSVH
ncbi:MAG TPA: protein-L-isoaspartate(D-aspartate) O-methyltransferase [Myxococcales bacterium]|nr:MAG: protein-L-isoaspartate(D-aspartate) O-methyltransferase [Deltaproteobacteria bacterium]HMC33264.1 protein-L-isoaspartate(D-aspartate) O-methyltransferase [Myxococcales bacterium]